MMAVGGAIALLDNKVNNVFTGTRTILCRCRAENCEFNATYDEKGSSIDLFENMTLNLKLLVRQSRDFH